MKTMAPPSGTPPRGTPYSRFIPREELSSFEAWTPGALSASGAGASSERPAAGPAGTARTDGDVSAQLRAARQAGYQDGYRDGLVALEGFKQSFASQSTAQIGALLEAVGSQLDALQQQMASALTDSATRLAQQIVRSELSTRPELVAEVAQQALEALMLSARHITLRIHPQDQALVAQGAGDTLTARGARLIADASVQRGGCLIESDIGSVDASIESRWRRSVAALGSERGWDEPEDAPADAPADAPLADPQHQDDGAAVAAAPDPVKP